MNNTVCEFVTVIVPFVNKGLQPPVSFGHSAREHCDAAEARDALLHICCTNKASVGSGAHSDGLATGYQAGWGCQFLSSCY